MTSAVVAAMLHEQVTGQPAKAVTPHEISTSPLSLEGTAVWALSASGKNVDIKRAVQHAIDHDAGSTAVVCARTKSPALEMVRGRHRSHAVGFELAGSGDGFLATKSLLATIVLLFRAYDIESEGAFAVPATLADALGCDPDAFIVNATDAMREVTEREALVVLHGSWTRSAAVDLESKLTEAGLACPLPADFRNFAHGRHHWLAKRGVCTSVLAFCDDVDHGLARRTLALLPDNIPQLLYRCPGGPFETTIRSLLATFAATLAAGEQRGIDPGRPGVPDFGRKLYSLKIGNRPKGDEPALRRKHAAVQGGRRPAGKHALRAGYETFVRQLGEARFGALAVDFDGTVAQAGVLDPEVGRRITDWVDAGLMVGIATGRGRSAGEELRRVLPKRVWKTVLVGYYNGAVIRALSDDGDLTNGLPSSPQLEAVAHALQHDARLADVEVEVRPSQASVLAGADHTPLEMWRLVSEVAASTRSEVLVVKSTHSVDVVAAEVSKQLVVDELKLRLDGARDVLCIGDSGSWPGNDFELLSGPFSLSVDEVSSNLTSCWNLAPEGVRGPAATRSYLESCVIEPIGARVDLIALGHN